MSDRCDLCGCPVKVVGKTTQHYEVDIARLLPDEKTWLEIYDDSYGDECKALSIYKRLRDEMKRKCEGVKVCGMKIIADPSIPPNEAELRGEHGSVRITNLAPTDSDKENKE